MKKHPLLTLGVVVIAALALSAATSVVLPINGGTGVPGNITGIPYASGTSPYVAATPSEMLASCTSCALSSVPGASGGLQVGGILGGWIGGVVNGGTYGIFATYGTNGDTDFHMPFNGQVRNLYAVTSTAGDALSPAALNFVSVDGVTTYRPQQSGYVQVGPNQTAGVYGPVFSPPFPVGQWEELYVGGNVLISGGTSPTFQGFAFDLVGSTSQPLATNLSANTVASSTTVYVAPSNYSGSTVTTEAQQGVVVPYAATAKNMCFRTNATQNAGGSLVVTLRDTHSGSTASTSVVATAAAGAAAGLYCDNTHTASVAAGDWIDWQITNNYAGTSASIYYISMELASPASPYTGMIIWGLKAETLSTSAPLYATPFANNTLQSTESLARAPMPRAVTMSNLACLYTTAPITDSMVVTVYKNGSAPASGLTITIPTGGSGTQIVTDSTHSITFAQGDTFDLQTNQSGGTAPALSSCSVAVD